MRIGITGAAGQLGSYTRAWLQHHYGMAVFPADRATFADQAALQNFCASVDAIVHLAGVNRGPEAEVRDGNPALAQSLVDACRSAKRAPHIVYSSSVQCDTGTLYGQSKAAAAGILRSFCGANGSRFLEIVFPNLFGEFTKPFYNSFVGTFCHQMARGEPLTVNSDAVVPLMHYQLAAETIGLAIKNEQCGTLRPSGVPVGVRTVADKLAAFEAEYSAGVVPDLRDNFDLQLFNTYRSYLYPDRYPVKLVRHADQRGTFFECVREKNGGQTSFSTTHPGITRGNHFHFNKFERFLVVSGQARISIRRIYSDDVKHFDVSGEAPCYIDMPTLHTHNITNTGEDELVTLFWSNDLFSPANPDTYIEAVA
jgi:UDP-2-acetamido-2,6-beta-L-arabino-hexul-4-ose reductase